MQSHDLVFFRTLSLLNRWSVYFLSALADGEATSTEVTRRIAKMTNGVIFLSAGSINEASSRLIEEGLMESAERRGGRGRRGRIYKLTREGKELLDRLYRLSDVYRKMLADSKAV